MCHHSPSNDIIPALQLFFLNMNPITTLQDSPLVSQKKSPNLHGTASSDQYWTEWYVHNAGY